MKRLRILSLAFACSATVLAISCNTKTSQTAEETEVLDKVVVEEEAPTVVEIAVGSPDHTTLVAAVSAAGLVETLNGDGPFTVFAPTNEAFGALPEGTVESLLEPENKDQLTSILTYHVVSGNVKAADLSDGQEVTTLQGGKFKVTIQDGKVYINDAVVTGADIEGVNGVVHIIDGVLLPG
jgi:uncharacterized surface protein with fasciclin (FAS1) repeats